MVFHEGGALREGGREEGGREGGREEGGAVVYRQLCIIDSPQHLDNYCLQPLVIIATAKGQRR